MSDTLSISHANHIGLGHAEVGSEARFRVMAEMVAGTAWAAATGAVALDLDDGRAFLREMTGNITELGFSNIPDGATQSASWVVALRIDSTGGYSFASTETLTWVDGMTWGDLDLAADAINLITFWRVGTETFAALSWNGSVRLDPYNVCFLDNATVVILTGDESIDIPNALKTGDGTVTYEKNGVAATARTSFAAGDGLGVICSGMTSTTSVRVPRFAL